MLLKFTVIAEYWATEKGLCRKVEAADDEEAVALVEAEVAAALKAQRLKSHLEAVARGWGAPEDMAPPEEDADDEEALLRIWAVLPGWV